MQRMVATAASAVVVSLAGVTPAGAQTWRTIDASRQARDTNPVAAHIEYAAGKLDLKPAAGGLLYATNVRYDADRAEPVADFDAASRVISLGVHLRGMHLTNVDDEHDAGSMRATDLSLRSGAADVTARFDQPNRERLRSMTLQVGAADVKLLDVANSGVSRIVAEVGAGSLSIDLGGALQHDVDITATLAIGGLKLNVSPDVGLFVDEKTVLGSFHKDGFTKRADGWYSDGYDKAARHVRVHLHAFMGGLELTRVQR
jgi:hypothetical protein